jgi:hypothetical protein
MIVALNLLMAQIAATFTLFGALILQRKNTPEQLPI